MKTKTEIDDLATYLETDLYSGLRAEQRKDLTYYDDTFKVPWIKSDKLIRRSGRGARMVDSPAENIITSNPIAYRDFKLKGDKDAASNVNTELNRWVSYLKAEIPNPFKSHVKTNLKFGEVYIQLVHNEKWLIPLTDDEGKDLKDEKGKPIFDRSGLPVLFLLPNPLNIYPSPEEHQGIPEFVATKYKRHPMILARMYPGWKKLEDLLADDLKKRHDFLAYIDNKQLFVEIDGEIVKDEGNMYGFVPFVHALSGFGSKDAEASMEEKIVGRLRRVRHLLERECGMDSDLDSTIHMFANPQMAFDIKEKTAELAAGWESEYKGDPNKAFRIPWGVDAKWMDRPLPSQEAFVYKQSIENEMEREDPLVMGGSPVGESGRLQDIVHGAAMSRYDTVVEATEQAYPTAMGLALRLCDEPERGGIPTLRPEGLKPNDINGDYNCRIELKAADPIEADRKATLGSRLYQNREIDLKTNLVEYQGKTPEAADRIIDQIMIDQVTIHSPYISEMLGLAYAKEAGYEKEFEEAKMMAEGEAPTNQLTSSAAERAGGEVKTETGREMIDQSLQKGGMRKPPGGGRV